MQNGGVVYVGLPSHGATTEDNRRITPVTVSFTDSAICSNQLSDTTTWPLPPDDVAGLGDQSLSLVSN